MSKYTTELRFICESKSGFDMATIYEKTPDQIIEAARPNIFNFSYPVYEASHKPELERKILRHYYTREINAETVGLWQLQLNATLNDIMPKYNRLYAAQKEILAKELKNIDIDITDLRTDDLLRTDNFTRTDNLRDIDSRTTEETASGHGSSTEAGQHSDTRTDNLVEAGSSTRTDNLNSTTTHGKTTRDRFSDTPQGTITNVDNDSYLTTYRNVAESGTTATANTGTEGTVTSKTNTGTQTNAGSESRTGSTTDTRETESSSSGTMEHTGTQKNDGTVKNTGTVTGEHHESGYRGEKIYASLLAEYADKVLNIDLMIIKELNNLFFLLW